ncbi:MAG: D-alanyl-D-alanine carboxypeptidase [Defluviitaleaceae bacterium]|nr:D-alanyl-D-alanine carboxypeptidase [Defluviitaleaceae bacterium]
MKKLITLSLLLTFIYPANIYAEETKKPEVNAHGAIIMDYKTGRVLWGKNENEPMSMASTTKIMTAIVALENGNMDDMVTVSKLAAASPNVQMHLTPGEKIRLGDLMYALMYTSYNDAAVAISEHVGGSVENFCKMMTDKAKEIGAVNTLFETPSGLDKGDHHSTAYDLAIIAKYALDNEEFMSLISGSEKVVRTERREYYLVNKNRLLREFKGANGMKTGFTNKAGHCFVGTAKRDDMQLITVVLASGWGSKGREQKWVDTKRLMNYGFENYEYKEVIVKDDEAGKIEVYRSKNTNIPALYSEGLIIPVNKEELEIISVHEEIPESLKAPVVLGDKLGTAKVYLGDQLYTEISIIASEGAERHDLKTSLEKVISSWIGLSTWADVKVELPEF